MKTRPARLLLLFVSALPLAAQQPAEQRAAQPAAPAKEDPDHAAKIADIQHLLDLTGGSQMFNEFMDQIRSTMSAEAQPFFDEMRKDFTADKLYQLIIPSYDRYLTRDDIKEMIRFYESPAGKRMKDAMPKITQDMFARSQVWAQELADKVHKRMQGQDIK